MKSCQAHQFVELVLKPSGCVPVGETMTYWADRFWVAVVLPKCPAAATASAANVCPVVWLIEATELSYHTPARAPPVG